MRISDWSSDVCSSDLGVGDDPGAVVQRARVDRGLAGADDIELRHVGGDGVVDHRPFLAQVVRGRGLHDARAGVGQCIVHVGARVLEHQGLLAAVHVHPVQGGGVAVARFEQVGGLAVGGEADVAGAEEVVERDLFGDLPAALAVGLEHVLAAVGSRASRQLHLRSEEHTSELQSLMRISYAVFCLKKKKKKIQNKFKQKKNNKQKKQKIRIKHKHYM